MRIGIGQLWQETNTLNPVPTTRVDFDQMGVLRGAEVVEQMRGVNEPGGFLDGLSSWRPAPDLVGTVRLPAWPSGPLTRETFDWIAAELKQQIPETLDAVLFALHGAMVADQHPDVEGDALSVIRDRVGPRTPLVATLDLHANVTAEMVRRTDALVAYHCAPHVDVYETGLRAAAVLERIVHHAAQPVTAFQKIPVVLPPERANTEAATGVSVDLKKRLQEIEGDPRVLSAAIATVQPWMDIPNLGSTALVVTDGEPELAATYCRELAGEVWRRRREYLPELQTVEEAVRLAHETPGLVVLSDAADATTSGAPGDSVWLLKELLKYAWVRPALAAMVAPDVVQQAAEVGQGGLLETELGGLRDTRFGTRIGFTGRVARLFDASFLLSGHIGKNMPVSMGPAAVLQSGNVTIVVTSRSGPHFAPELFQAAGCDPYQADVLIAKSPCGFRAVYESRAAAVYNVRAPGCAPTDFWNYPFERIDRPLWPWDEFEDWSPAPEIIQAFHRSSPRNS